MCSLLTCIPCHIHYIIQSVALIDDNPLFSCVYPQTPIQVAYFCWLPSSHSTCASSQPHCFTMLLWPLTLLSQSCWITSMLLSLVHWIAPAISWLRLCRALKIVTPGSFGGTGDEEGLDESEPTAQDLGCNKEDDGESDHEVTEEKPDYFSDINPLHFHEETNFELYLPPSDIQAQLKAWLGPASQKELHSIVTSKSVAMSNLDMVCAACHKHRWESCLALVGPDIVLTLGYESVPGSCDLAQGRQRYVHFKTVISLEHFFHFWFARCDLS